MTPRSWLPAGLEFLSGLPEDARKRRVLVPVQVFVDDSGGKGQTRTFLLAGLISYSEKWAEFATEWQAVLDTSPRLDYFKMREAVGLSGQFHRWSKADRDAKLRALAQTINRHVATVNYVAFDVAAHGATLAIGNRKPLNELYFWPFHNMIIGSCFELWDFGWRKPFEIIFDEQVIFGPRALAWYPVVRDVMKAIHPEESAILPLSPMFKSDNEFLPLQAADLFAWCFRHASDNRDDAEKRDEFVWLLPEMSSVQASDYAGYYDLRRFGGVQELSTRMKRQHADLLNDLAEKYRELFE